MYKHAIYLILFLASLILAAALNLTSIVKIYIKSDKTRDIQYNLYYKKPIPHLFDVEQKISAKEKRCKGKSYHQLKFILPFATATQQFRLDFGNKDGRKFKIYKIEVASRSGLFRKTLGPESFDRIQMANHVTEISRDKDSLTLRSTGQDPYIIIDMNMRDSIHLSLPVILLILLLITTLFPLFFPEKTDKAVDFIKTIIYKNGLIIIGLSSKISPYYLLTVIFFIAFMMGLTGSSIGLIRNGCISVPIGEKKLFGNYQPIRTDEINAHGTASAIQSYKNIPRFHMINHNIGLSGRNFLFFHDWGAPVKHVSMLIRPSNWMFFFTGLRHALSWYWLFPIFMGIISLMLFMDTLYEKDSWLHFITASGLVFSPYCVGWSFWPINCSAGAFLAAASLIRLFQSRRVPAMFGWAILAGWGVSVSVATLYFPHIWPCVTLAIVIAVVKIAVSWNENHLFLFWKAVSFLIFLLTAGFLLYLFFDAIREPLCLAMKSEAGNRVRNGGLFQVWELFRGWLFPFTLYYQIYINQSEAQAYQFIFIPLLLLFSWNYSQLKSRPLCWALLLFLLWSFVYQLIGLLDMAAKITGWNHCTENRICFAVQLAQVFLLIAFAHIPRQKNSWQHFSVAIIFSILLTILAAICLYWIPDSFRNNIFKLERYQIFKFLLICTSLFFLSNAVILYNPRWGAVVFALITGTAGFIFNPICLAPTDIKSSLVEEIKASSDLKYGGRILLISNSLSSAHQQQFVMAGGKVFNGFFCYEDTEIFDSLLKNLPNSKSFHRLNHMSVVLTADDNLFSAEIPQGDCIRLRINGEKFDFSKLPIDYVVNLVQNKEVGLEKNPTLFFYKDCGAWMLWRVKPSNDKL